MSSPHPPPKFPSQVDCKFIALRCGQLLMACDQHAADERVRLESLTAAVRAARGRHWGSDGHSGGSSGSGYQAGNGGGVGRGAMLLVWPDCEALSSFRLAQPQVR